MVVHRTTAVIILGSPTKFLVVLRLPDYHYFDPWSIWQSQDYLDVNNKLFVHGSCIPYLIALFRRNCISIGIIITTLIKNIMNFSGNCKMLQL